jgi:hypothetical protein
VKIRLKLRLGCGLAIIDDDWQEHTAAKGDGHVDMESAAQYPATRCEGRLRCDDFVDRCCAGGKIGLAVGRKPRHPGGSVEQLEAHPCLEPVDGLANR